MGVCNTKTNDANVLWIDPCTTDPRGRPELIRTTSDEIVKGSGWGCGNCPCVDDGAFLSCQREGFQDQPKTLDVEVPAFSAPSGKVVCGSVCVGIDSIDIQGTYTLSVNQPFASDCLTASAGCCDCAPCTWIALISNAITFSNFDLDAQGNCTTTNVCCDGTCCDTITCNAFIRVVRNSGKWTVDIQTCMTGNTYEKQDKCSNSTTTTKVCPTLVDNDCSSGSICPFTDDTWTIVSPFDIATTNCRTVACKSPSQSADICNKIAANDTGGQFRIRQCGDSGSCGDDLAS